MSIVGFSTIFREILQKNGLNRFCSDEIVSQFERFTERYLAQNAVSNISAIRTVPEIVAKHYADCLLAEELLPSGASVLDIGCGGGFPCIPLAIARPDLKITAVDSTAKKLQFVADMADFLHLSHLNTVCARVEDAAFAEKHRECFDVTVSRAVAALRVLAELSLPFTCVNGCLIALKGAQADEELQAAQNSIRTLGGKLERDCACTLYAPKKMNSSAENDDQSAPNDGTLDFQPENRHLLLIRKIAPSDPKYPRAYAAICKKPL